MNATATTNDSTTGDELVTRRLNLADPDERPGADVVIFDGKCRFCQKQVVRLNWFDGGHRLAFISLHDPRVGERFSDLTHDQMMEQMYVVSPDGKRFAGASAMRYLSRRLPALWWTMPFLHLPFSLPLWQWMYKQVASRRYKLNQDDSDDCRDGTCKIHLD